MKKAAKKSTKASKKQAPKKLKKAPIKPSKPAKLLAKLGSKAQALKAKFVKAAKSNGADKKKASGQAANPAEAEKEVVLTNADGKIYCRVHDCDSEATTENYCRFHYLALWKRNKIKAKILQGGKLDKYIEDLTSKYPDKYLEMLRKDLSSEKDFNLIVAEMDVEDSGDEIENEEETSRFIEEVRGGVPSSSDEDEGGF